MRAATHYSRLAAAAAAAAAARPFPLLVALRAEEVRIGWSPDEAALIEHDLILWHGCYAIAVVMCHNRAALEASIHVVLDQIADCEAQCHLLLIAPRGLDEGPGRDPLTVADLSDVLSG